VITKRISLFLALIGLGLCGIPRILEGAEPVAAKGLAPAKGPAPAKGQAPPEGQASAKKEEIRMVPRTLMGQVSAASSNGVAVVVERDLVKGRERELWFPVGPDVKRVGIRDLKGLNPGDLIEVMYLEAEDQSRRIATRITFLAPAAPEPSAGEGEGEGEEGEGAPETETAELRSLEVKR